MNWAYVNSLKVSAQPQRASHKKDAFRSFYHEQRFISQHKCVCVIQPVNQSSKLQVSNSQPDFTFAVTDFQIPRTGRSPDLMSVSNISGFIASELVWNGNTPDSIIFQT